MKVLLLGTIVSDDQRESFLEKGISPAPADIAQKYLITSLVKNNDVDSVHTISSARIKTYPSVKIKKVKTQKWSFGESEVNTVGFLNLPLINIVSRQHNIISEARKWARMHKNDEVAIIAYSLHTPFLKAAIAVKKIIKNAKISVIIADLPKYMSTGNAVRRMLKKIDEGTIKRLMPSVDKFILYSKYMAQAYNLPSEKWIVMEGLFDADRLDTTETEKYSERVCIYAGNLNPKYAIGTLIEAFERTSVQDARLWIFGNPEAGERLKEQYSECKRFEYKGMLLPEEMFRVMQKARLLINPRPSTLPLSRYSFPSKTFEYMASGTPVLMTKLPSLPEEYCPYLYLFEDESIDGFARTLENVLSLSDDELNEMGRRARLFIKEQKNSDAQVKKIIDFIIKD